MRQNGGWVEVSSEVNRGTTFRIYLPRVDACRLAVPENAAASAASKHGGETVLLVEDQENVRKLAATILKKYGYRVLDARDGAEAYLVAREYPGEIHLLLTDVVMPGMNGRDLSELLKGARPSMKVLYSSGYTADVMAHRGVLEPHVAYLSKPFTAAALATKVREVLLD